MDNLSPKTNSATRKTYPALYLVIFVLLSLFVLIAVSVITRSIITVYDQEIIVNVHEHLIAWLTPMVMAITSIGNAGSAWIISILIAIVIFCLGKKKESYFVVFSTAGAATLMNLIKAYVHRPRPELLNPLFIEPGFSFPSGHALVSTCLYGSLAILIWKQKWPLKLRVALCTIIAIMILLVGLSRVYLGVHYPSDVLAGFILGLAWLGICLIVYRMID